ncbi:hypothetical protein ACWDWU_15830 [Streptomyces sp. NPDC003442]
MPARNSWRHTWACPTTPARINEVLALHAGFLLRTAGAAGPAADPNIVAMMTASGLASLRWLRSAQP